MVKIVVNGPDEIIFREMMAHPVLFTHPAPADIALIGDEDNAVLSEIIKHPKLACIHHIKNNQSVTKDPRVQSYFKSPKDWIAQSKLELGIDVLINMETPEFDCLQRYYQILKPEGILLQRCGPLFQISELTLFAEKCQNAGFLDLQVLHFPQSSAPGPRAAILALKQGTFKPVREKIIFNKKFTTDYYNFDMHKAAVALPEFMRREWVI